MRVWQAVGIGLLAITFSLPAWADCSPEIFGNTDIKVTTLSIPTTIFVRKLPVLSHILPNIEVTLLFDAEMKFELSCVCKPCCSNQEKQVASLTVSASVEALGGTIWYEDSRSLTMDGVQDPECQLLVTLAHEKGATVPAVGVGLQIAGFSLKIEGVRMSFSAIPRCGCTSDEQCFFNTPPRIVDVSPQSLDLNKGESAEFTVTAIDFQGNLSHFSEATPAGPGYLRAYLKGEQYGKTEEGWEWRTATYRVSFPSEGEELEGRVVVTAWDGCGQHSEKKVLVRLFYPPRITLDQNAENH